MADLHEFGVTSWLCIRISHLADVTRGSLADSEEVDDLEIRIQVDGHPPPTGNVQLSRRKDPVSGARQFAGWLGLLRVLSDALEDSPAVVEPAEGTPDSLRLPSDLRQRRIVVCSYERDQRRNGR